MWFKKNPKITDQIVDNGGILIELTNEKDFNGYYFIDTSYGEIVATLQSYNQTTDNYIYENIHLRNCTDQDQNGGLCLDDVIALKCTEQKCGHRSLNYIELLC